MSRRAQYWLLALVLAIIAGGVWHVRQGQQASLEWPVTQGRILVAFVEETVDGRNMALASPHFHVHVEYAYEVAGQPYRGTRTRILSERHRERAAAELELRAYPVGQVVKVHYDPARPDQSVLQPG